MPDALPNDPADPVATPPWGDDFDAEKAWTLVQNLRADKAKLSTDLQTERQAREVAEKAVSEQGTDGKVKAAEDRATAAERTLFVERAIRKHGLEDDDVDFLTGDTEEAILAKAERLATRGKKADPDPAADPEPEPTPAPEIPGKPKADLTPGHGGDIPIAFDPDAIVKRVRGIR